MAHIELPLHMILKGIDKLPDSVWHRIPGFKPSKSGDTDSRGDRTPSRAISKHSRSRSTTQARDRSDSWRPSASREVRARDWPRQHAGSYSARSRLRERRLSDVGPSEQTETSQPRNDRATLLPRSKSFTKAQQTTGLSRLATDAAMKNEAEHVSERRGSVPLHIQLPPRDAPAYWPPNPGWPNQSLGTAESDYGASTTRSSATWSAQPVFPAYSNESFAVPWQDRQSNSASGQHSRNMYAYNRDDLAQHFPEAASPGMNSPLLPSSPCMHPHCPSRSPSVTNIKPPAYMHRYRPPFPPASGQTSTVSTPGCSKPAQFPPLQQEPMVPTGSHPNTFPTGSGPASPQYFPSPQSVSSTMYRRSSTASQRTMPSSNTTSPPPLHLSNPLSRQSSISSTQKPPSQRSSVSRVRSDNSDSAGPAIPAHLRSETGKRRSSLMQQLEELRDETPEPRTPDVWRAMTPGIIGTYHQTRRSDDEEIRGQS